MRSISRSVLVAGASLAVIGAPTASAEITPPVTISTVGSLSNRLAPRR